MLRFILLRLSDVKLREDFSKDLSEALELVAENKSLEKYDIMLSQWEAITEIELSESTQEALMRFEEEYDNYEMYPLA